MTLQTNSSDSKWNIAIGQESKIEVPNRFGKEFVAWVIEFCEVLSRRYLWISQFRPTISDCSEEGGSEEEQFYFGEPIDDFISELTEMNSNTDSQIKMKLCDIEWLKSMHLQENIVSATMKVLPYLQSNGWIVKPTISSDRNRNASIISGAAAIGAKVKILVEQSNEEDLSDGSCECKYFLSGTVIAYLPPDEDEPMELYKVIVDVAEQRDNTCVQSSELVWFEDLEEHELLPISPIENSEYI